MMSSVPAVQLGDDARVFDTLDQEEPTSPVLIIDPTLRDRGVLIESSGLFAGRPHCLAVETTIGRSPDCGIRIDDEALSRQHARIVLGGGRYVLEDMGRSTAATWATVG